MSVLSGRRISSPIAACLVAAVAPTSSAAHASGAPPSAGHGGKRCDASCKAQAAGDAQSQLHTSGAPT